MFFQFTQTLQQTLSVLESKVTWQSCDSTLKGYYNCKIIEVPHQRWLGDLEGWLFHLGSGLSDAPGWQSVAASQTVAVEGSLQSDDCWTPVWLRVCTCIKCVCMCVCVCVCVCVCDFTKLTTFSNSVTNVLDKFWQWELTGTSKITILLMDFTVCTSMHPHTHTYILKGKL